MMPDDPLNDNNSSNRPQHRNAFEDFINYELVIDLFNGDAATADPALRERVEAEFRRVLQMRERRPYWRHVMTAQQRQMHAVLQTLLEQYFREERRFFNREDEIGIAISMAWLMLMQLDQDDEQRSWHDPGNSATDD